MWCVSGVVRAGGKAKGIGEIYVHIKMYVCAFEGTGTFPPVYFFARIVTIHNIEEKRFLSMNFLPTILALDHTNPFTAEKIPSTWFVKITHSLSLFCIFEEKQWPKGFCYF